MTLTENILSVTERIRQAAQRANRSTEDITLVAVSKTVSEAAIREAYDCGLRIFGENRPQELEHKASALADLRDIRWHMIGHLQRNKVKTVLPIAALIHAVDSLRLAEELDRQSRQKGLVTPILLEVNVSGEETKFGFAEGEILDACESLASMSGVSVRGLMTMAPLTADPEQARAVFAQTRELADKIAERGYQDIGMSELSMGMSNDFEVAVEEGATIVRVGTALWQGLDP